MQTQFLDVKIKYKKVFTYTEFDLRLRDFEKSFQLILFL